MVDPFRPSPLSKPGPPRLDNIVAVITGGWVIFVALHLMKGRLFHAGIDAVMVTLSGVLWYFARQDDGRFRTLIGNLNLSISTSGLFLVAYFSGQNIAMACWYLAVVPLIATFQFGIRGALAWTAIAFVLLSTVHLSGIYHPITPEYVAVGSEILFGQIFLLATLALFAFSSHRGTARYLAALVEHEQALREKADTLAAHADELQSARDEALTALRVKGDFLSNMSHEVRTPLNGVLGMTRVLLNTTLSSEQRRMVSAIDTSGQALMTVINDVLDFAKIEAGEMKIESTPFSLRECAEEVLELFAHAAHEKNLDLAYRQIEGVPTRVLGDPYRVRQILLNLVNNAVKFTPVSRSRPGHVVVEAARVHDGIELRVRDTGIGISAADQAKLFESFVQVDTSMARRFGGTGLGLAISRGLVQAMGGTIRVESEVGQGATFILQLPLHEAPVLLHTAELEDMTTALERAILIVGPHTPSRTVLCELARSWSMTVDATNDPELVADILEVEPPDVMVAWDDDETVALARQIQAAHPRLPILVCTNFATFAPLDGFDGTLYRPIRFRQTLEALANTLQADTKELQAPATVSDQLPLRILIVEDNPVNQQVVVTMMNRLGYHPDVASDGREAVEKANAQTFDFIFMDMHMPDMDGLEATRRIRELQNGAKPWIAALTASVADEQRKACEDVGMNDFVPKPFRFEMLVSAIERAAQTQGWITSPVAAPPLRAPQTDLREMYRGNDAGFFDLVRRHLETSDDLLASMHSAIQSDDYEGIVLRAHSLKSSAAMFGEDHISKLAAEIERSAKNKLVEATSKMLVDLSRKWELQRAAWEQELPRDA